MQGMHRIYRANRTRGIGRRIAALSLQILALATLAHADAVPVYKDPGAPLEARVSDLFSRLTPDEKISLLAGTEFTTRPIPRLGVPPMAMADAGQGVRGGMKSTLGPATAFPSGVTMASTWNPRLIGRVGTAIGVEAQNKGIGLQVMLGPAVNIQRSPLGGATTSISPKTRSWRGVWASPISAGCKEWARSRASSTKPRRPLWH